jgi:hypothetical protein
VPQSSALFSVVPVSIAASRIGAAQRRPLVISEPAKAYSSPVVDMLFPAPEPRFWAVIMCKTGAKNDARFAPVCKKAFIYFIGYRFKSAIRLIITSLYHYLRKNSLICKANLHEVLDSTVDLI